MVLKTLAILIPNFNQSHLLVATLESLEHWASRSPYVDEVEILIADNDSEDGSIALINSFTQVKFTKFFHEENIGFAGNFWFLLAQSKSDWSTFIGSGELIKPNELDSVIEALKLQATSTVVVQTLISHSGSDQEVEFDEAKATPFNASIAGNFFRQSATISSDVAVPEYRYGPWPHVYLALALLQTSGKHGLFRLALRPFEIDQSAGWWLTSSVWPNLITLQALLVWGEENLDPYFQTPLRAARASRNVRILLAWVTRARLASRQKPNSSEILALAKSCLPNLFSAFLLVLVATMPLLALDLLNSSLRRINRVVRLI